MSMSKQILITEEGYEGKYVAMRSMSDRTIIASGSNPDAVMKQANKQGVTDPVIFFVPNHDITLVF